MQKSYYDHNNSYQQGYYANSNGYNYESQMAYGVGQTPGPPVPDNYRPSCVMQGPTGPIHPQSGPPMGYPPHSEFQHQYPPNSCMQDGPGMGVINIAPQGNGGSGSTAQAPSSQAPDMKPPPEIFPWMRENRQNGKQRQLSTSPGRWLV